MRPAALWLLLLAGCAAAPSRAPSLEQVLDRPEGPRPHRLTFHNERLLYLLPQPDSERNDLWVLDLAGGERRILLGAGASNPLSTEERSRRERRRERGEGVGLFRPNPKEDSVLVVRAGDLWLLEEGRLRRLTDTPEPELDPRWSPDGRSIAFVRERNLFVWRDGVEIRLTSDGQDAVSCGLADFIAMEELGRHEGFWWSPDSRRIAWVRVDESEVPEFRYHDYLEGRGRTVVQRYPRPGDSNAEWRLFVSTVGQAGAVPLPVRDEYLVRVDWTPEGALAVQVADRPQKRLRLLRCDPGGGSVETLLEERDPAWVAFHRDLRFLENGRILWSSERTGRRHLYLYDKKEARALTSGDWDVAGVVAVDPTGRTVWFSGSREGPRERHLYRVGLDGREPERVTAAPGWHAVQASEDARWFVDSWSQAGRPPEVGLLDAGSGLWRTIFRSRDLEGLPRPRFVRIEGEGGAPLEAMLLRSARPGRRPCIVFCYGGPGSHLVADRWGSATYLWHVRLTRLGYHVLTVDGRGAGGYGTAFRDVVSGRLCDWEVRDQAAAARWLGAQPWADPARIGIWGWSYGGTLSLMCLLHAPELFAAAVAVAPVTDWRDYDTAYTERYLGLPGANPQGYEASSPVTAARKLRRPLLLAHGLMDDNVHARGALAFLDAAGASGRHIETMLFPRGAHGIGGKPERLLLFERMERFWESHLGR